ncbi:PfkB family carbohydrate kinase [Plantactinospora sonchi]|uniref:PfkB family carbohydrate kinase n=1 Tax=Plantactinospora sonchi TaxID=1544735 RepID=A0ABU7RLI5_9ACTN
MAASRVLVVGQLARDLVLTVPEMPGTDDAADVGQRRELLGGKGANQAVALGQLSTAPTLLAVVGDDEVADHLLAGRLVVLDGAPADDRHRTPLLAAADVLRADDRETALLTGVEDNNPDRVRAAAVELLDAGPRLLALGLGSAGNLFVWRDDRAGTDHLLVPLSRENVVDTTGAGDALTAALTVALLRGEPPGSAARYAVAAAGATVGHPGGRPDLTPGALADRLAELDARLGTGATPPTTAADARRT